MVCKAGQSALYTGIIGLSSIREASEKTLTILHTHGPTRVLRSGQVSWRAWGSRWCPFPQAFQLQEWFHTGPGPLQGKTGRGFSRLYLCHWSLKQLWEPSGVRCPPTLIQLWLEKGHGCSPQAPPRFLDRCSPLPPSATPHHSSAHRGRAKSGAEVHAQGEETGALRPSGSVKDHQMSGSLSQHHCCPPFPWRSSVQRQLGGAKTPPSTLSDTSHLPFTLADNQPSVLWFLNPKRSFSC